MGTQQNKETKKVKRAHSLFIDNLKIYQESHQKLEVINEMIVKASMERVTMLRNLHKLFLEKVKLMH